MVAIDLTCIHFGNLTRSVICSVNSYTALIYTATIELSVSKCCYYVTVLLQVLVADALCMWNTCYFDTEVMFSLPASKISHPLIVLDSLIQLDLLYYNHEKLFKTFSPATFSKNLSWKNISDDLIYAIMLNLNKYLVFSTEKNKQKTVTRSSQDKTTM